MTAAAAAPDPHAGWRPKHNPWLVTISVMLATFMEVLDTSIANVALPHIAGNLSVTPEEATWVLTSYLVANAVILAAASWLSRYFGRKRYLAFSVALFVIASALCGMAQSLPQLVVARILQGLGGGGLQPLVQAVLLESFAPEERGAAMAAYGMGIVVAPIIGPTLGGWITDNYSWRWIFYINLPIGVLGLVLQQIFLEDPPWISEAKAKVIDYVGFGLLAVGIGLLQLVLDKGQEADWFAARWIVWSTAIGVFALACFTLWELDQDEPVMNVRLLGNRNLATGCVLMGAIGGVLYGTTAILPIFMQTLLGYTATLSGLAMTPRGIGSMLSMFLIGRLMKKADPRAWMMLGFCILAYTCWELSHLSLEVTKSNISWTLVLNGFAMGFIFVPMTTMSMATLKQSEIGQGTGIYSLLRNLGASIGISAMVAYQSRQVQAHQVTLVTHVSAYDLQFRMWSARLSSALGRAGLAVPAAYRAVMGQAALLSFNDCFRILALVCIVAIPAAALFEKGHIPSGPVMEH
jgi:DHA2 family multidrug resistance protein